jgi:hypothetical protein
VLIWAIPPLSPQPSYFPDNIRDDNPNLIPPLFKIPFPDDIARYTRRSLTWKTLSSWYFGFSGEIVYFDMIYTQIQRFKIIIKPDLSDASLHVINIPETISGDLKESSVAFRIYEGYRICEDALVYSWNNHKTWGAYTGLTSAPFTKVFTRWDGHVISLCPTSGRFVGRASDGKKKKLKTVVVDLF